MASTDLIPGAIGFFNFSVRQNVSICDPLNQTIIGAKKRALTHNDVAQLVCQKDRQRFIDTSLGKAGTADAAQGVYTLLNGNVVRDTYTYIYHAQDYSRRTLLGVAGETILLAQLD
jgi:hypothetical protein